MSCDESGSEGLVAKAEGHRADEETRFFGFYDRLRRRTLGYVERRRGRLGARATEALLVVPDVFMLLVRLALDRRVPEASRALIGGALLYFVLPFDLFPEALAGPVAYSDDLLLAAAVISNAFGSPVEDRARDHWSGSEDLRVLLRDVASTARVLVGGGVTRRLGKLLGRYGIRLE